MSKYLIGIDEVGRGPIAGPVAIGGAVVCAQNPQKYLNKVFKGIKDSKQLSESQRIKWLDKMNKEKVSGNIDFRVSFVSHKIVDSSGLSKSIKLALSRTLIKLPHSLQNTTILLDGGLKAPEIYKKQQTIIKGDEKEIIIALASIVAKVKRDQKMVRLSKKYPNYCFDEHKGYGTKKHYKCIKKHGVSDIHRTTFLKNLYL